eukprot:1831929-Lingulodinium_polyedra.AAC.1
MQTVWRSGDAQNAGEAWCSARRPFGARAIADALEANPGKEPQEGCGKRLATAAAHRATGRPTLTQIAH